MRPLVHRHPKHSFSCTILLKSYCLLIVLVVSLMLRVIQESFEAAIRGCNFFFYRSLCMRSPPPRSLQCAAVFVPRSTVPELLFCFSGTSSIDGERVNGRAQRGMHRRR